MPPTSPSRSSWDRATAIAISVENKALPDRVPAGPSPSGGLFAGLTGGYPATTYDFFPYAGLHRPVLLFSVPATHIEDVTVRTTLEGADGRVDLRVQATSGYSGAGAHAWARSRLRCASGTARPRSRCACPRRGPGARATRISIR